MIEIPYSVIRVRHDKLLPYLVTKNGEVVCELRTKHYDEDGDTINYKAVCPKTGNLLADWLSLNKLKTMIRDGDL